MRSAASVLDVDAIPNDHRPFGESEHDADANTEPIAGRHCIAVAHRDRRTDDRSREPDPNIAWARPLLRGRRRAHTGA
ncbi:MAG TPA: hypothetical protein VJ726_04825 [Candidatus Limnocylindria bacterium]|nr:hypothetical protein [Candidatus Limnocylindria bacterium]